MPELPEVESIRRSLAPIVGKRLERVRLVRRDVVITADDPAGGISRARGERRVATQRGVTPEELLVGARVAELTRHGKQLAIIADNDRALIVQLGMTGALTLAAAASSRETHTHIVWTLDDGSRLAFVDPRRFGGVRVMSSTSDVERLWSGLGPDALTVRGDALRRALEGSGRAIKSALLDQRTIAGVGNIYADEALFAAGIHPAARAGELSSAHCATLAGAIRATLRRAIRAGGSTLRDYRDANGSAGAFTAKHAVYGRGGKACVRCGSTLAEAVMAQRTTTWCPACQPGSIRSSTGRPQKKRDARSRPTADSDVKSRRTGRL